EGAVVQAKARPRLIENGMASTALVAWIATAKFAWGSTLYRQVQILAGHGVHLDRSTLAVWMKRAAWWLKGLYELQLRCTRIRDCFATRRRCRCSIPGEARSRNARSGRMPSTTDPGRAPRRRRLLMFLLEAGERRRSPPS